MANHYPNKKLKVFTLNSNQSLAQEVERVALMNQTPVVLCSPAIRMYLRQITERYFPQIPILSYNELEASIEVPSVAVVDIGSNRKHM